MPADPSGGDPIGQDGDLSRTADLLTGTREGSPDAREELFARFRGRLARLLHARMPAGARSLLDTDDLVQEVCARAFATLDRFEYRGIGSFWAYLRAIAINHLREVSRRDRNLPPDQPLEAAEPPADPGTDACPVRALSRKEEFEAFETALQCISRTSRDALLLRFELGLDYATIAGECGFPSADAARMAICRAVERVATELSRGGFDR